MKDEQIEDAVTSLMSATQEIIDAVRCIDELLATQLGRHLREAEQDLADALKAVSK